MANFRADDLKRFTAGLFHAAGATEDHARIVGDSLVESNLCGHDSHGVVLVGMYIGQIRSGGLVPGGPWQTVRETPSLLIADGGLGFGQIQCRRLVDEVSAKARAVGLAGGTLRRCGHVGRLGEWVELAAKNGLAAQISVNDNGVSYFVAPPGGIEPRLSTNPIAIGVPTSDGPLVLDISTSAVANGKVRVARLTGKPCPPGWIQDAEGNPSTDPFVMVANPRGTLLPFGGEQAYKGFGLGLLFDILAGGLSGGSCPPAAPGTHEWNNVVLVAWDPEMCSGREHFLQEADKIVGSVRETRRKPGVDKIRLPGDRAKAVRPERLRDGIPLIGDNWKTLEKLAGELGVELPKPV